MRTISSDMGHELSAPLNSLMYRLSMLQDQVVSDEVRNHVKISNEACSRLTSLVTECRTLGSYDDMSHAQLSLMRMDHLVRDAVAEMQILFDSRDINLCIGQLDAATVMGNREGLTRVITNLLSNALRYGKPQGCVCVCVTKEARTVHLIVRDDGEGIPSEDLPHLFERYYRANRSADTEGSGLGSAIVKAVVDGHGGSVTVSSELGNGTRFEVAIPKFSNQIFMGLPLLREW